MQTTQTEHLNQIQLIKTSTGKILKHLTQAPARMATAEHLPEQLTAVNFISAIYYPKHYDEDCTRIERIKEGALVFFGGHLRLKRLPYNRNFAVLILINLLIYATRFE